MKHHRSNLFLRAAVALLVVFLVISIVDMQIQFTNLSARKQKLQKEVIEVKDDIAELEIEIQQAKEMTDEYIARVAIDKLGYRYKDDMVFYNDVAN